MTREIAIRSGTLVLQGRIVAPEHPRAAVVLLHGIPGGGPPDPPELGYPGFAQSFCDAGYAAMYFDFRGVRGAPGDFSLSGWAMDLDSALDALAEHAGDLARIVVGSSAGGSVAISVAARRPDVAAVATLAAPAAYEGLGSDPEAVIARFRNLGIIHDPAFPPDARAWWREFSDAAPEHAAARISPRPLLVIHGDADEVVAYPHAERIFAAASEPKEIVRIPGGGHQLRRDPRALDALLDWLDHLDIGASAR